MTYGFQVYGLADMSKMKNKEPHVLIHIAVPEEKALLFKKHVKETGGNMTAILTERIKNYLIENGAIKKPDFEKLRKELFAD